MKGIKIKKIIIPLIFILFLPIVYSGTLASSSISSYILEESFTSNNLFTDRGMTSRDTADDHNWSLSRGCSSDTNQNPRNSSWDELIFDSYSYGVNYTTACPFGSSITLNGNLPVNTTDSVIIITYNLSIQEHDGAGTPLTLSLFSHFNLSNGIVFVHGRNTTGISPYNAQASVFGSNCNLSLTSDVPQTIEFTIIIDQVLNVYSWFADGENDGDCDNVNFAGNNIDILGLGHIRLDSGISENIFSEVYFDDLKIGTGTSDSSVISSEECPFPLLFCDDFNYNTPLQGNNWIVFDAGGSINNTFSPIDNKLVLDGASTLRPFHNVPIFTTSYFPDSEGRFLRHFQAPAFSSEFILNFNNNTDNEFKYSAFEKVGNIGWTIRIQMDTDGSSNTGGNASGDMNWFFRNSTSTSASDFVELCSNCTFSNTDIFVKINSFFAQRDSFPFNSSVTKDEVAVYANDKLLGKWFNFITDNRFTSIREYEFSKINEGNFSIDNYNVMVGTDVLTDTSQFFYDDFYDNITAGQQVLPTGETGELIDAVNTIWEDFGMTTQASRIFAGIFLMFFLAVILFGAYMASGQPVSVLAIGIIELFFMIFLIYIKLLPAWIGFVLVIITGGIAALTFKMASG